MPRHEPPLWITFRGAAASLALAWVAWATGAGLFALVTREPFAEAAGVVPILLVGWVLARHVPSPLEAWKRYHLDDGELTGLGPLRRVRRIAWADVESVTQTRLGLVVTGAGRTVRVPLPALRASAGWGTVLVRVVPVVAARLWSRVDRGPVHLRPALDPPLGATVAWAWIPAALTCLATADWRNVALAAAAAAAERVIVFVIARAQTVILDPRGVTLPGRRARALVPWADVLATATPTGLEIARPGHDPEHVPVGVRDFWAAAPVIELRAQLGPDCAGDVCFRARVDGGALAVVGEVEAAG